MIDLRPDHLAVVQGILATEIPNTEIWAFGSRAEWTSSDTSDLDLAIRANEPLPLRVLNRLRGLFEESYLPFSVDIVDWHRIDESFRNTIRAGMVLVASPRNKATENLVENHWRVTPLAECADFLSGGTPAKNRRELWDGSIPWVSGKDMKQPRIHDTVDHVAPQAIGNGTRLVPPGTILVLARGMMLHKDIPICLTKAGMAFNQDIKALIPRPGVEPQFLAYSLLGNKQAIRTLVDAASHGRGRINSAAFRSFPIALPPVTEQRRIVAGLGALDDKIELNRNMNRTLEELAQAIGLQERFAEQCEPLRARQRLNMEQSQTLAQVRDALLPKLISGAIRIPEAEKAVEEHTDALPHRPTESRCHP